MKPPPFEYLAPESLPEALALLAEHGSDAKVLAGGQSLIPAMNFRLANPKVLVDLNRVSELSYIRAEKGSVSIGAMTRQRHLERSELVRDQLPLMAETMPQIAHPQIRNRGTIGGSLAHADPAAELPVIAVALGASLVMRSSSAEREVAAADFFYGMFMIDLMPGEMLAEIRFPARAPRTGYAFIELARRHGDYAMMGLAAVLTLDEGGAISAAKLVYLNAGDKPVDAAGAAALLVGQQPGAEAFRAAGQHASTQEMEPYGNVHASPEYQRHLARVLTQRALTLASERARAS